LRLHDRRCRCHPPLLVDMHAHIDRDRGGDAGTYTCGNDTKTLEYVKKPDLSSSIDLAKTGANASAINLSAKARRWVNCCCPSTGSSTLAMACTT
jgi:hypothetical protein